MVDLTTEIPGGGGGGNAGSSFSSRFFNVYAEGGEVYLDTTLSIVLDVARPTSTVLRFLSSIDRTISFPDADGAVAMGAAANQFSQIQEFDFDGSITNQFMKIVDSNLVTTLNLLGPTFLSIDRTQSLPDASGMYTVVGADADPPAAGFMGKVNRTAQTADIASVKLTDTCPAGQYLIVGELECTTGAGGAGTVTVTFSWTNDSGAKTSAVTLSLATAGSTPILIPAYLASGDITWAVTHTGLYLTSQYALRVRPISLG